ncbi:hypothetical protein [Aureivirga sp. CE67]|uniref:hypothetical protein n=1 Tax=Aureivirga sp. CE67 TaxID=1788983 RepID=UPI0018C9107E|nr:hypothetical protein [Aureivirga sp. CE67]
MKKYLLFIYILIFSSCVSVKKSKATKPVTKLSEENLYQILGTYKNSSLNSIGHLWGILNYSSNKEFKNEKDLVVEIYQEENQIYAALKDGENILDTKKLKGRIHQDFYLLNTQMKFDTFYFLINGVGDSSVKLTLHNQNLYCLTKTEGIGFILIVPGFASGGDLTNYEFERIK